MTDQTRDRDRSVIAEDLAPTGAHAAAKEYARKEARTMKDQGITTGQTWGAAFRSENVFVSTAVSQSTRHWFEEYDPDYTAVVPEKYKNTPYGHKFLYAKNQQHQDAILNDVEREIEDDAILQKAGMGAILPSLAAGIASPFVLLPAGTIIKGAKGVSVLKTVGSGAVAGAMGVAADEAVLQATQQTRTASESGYAIAGGAILGGLLGGAAGLLSKSEFDNLSVKLSEDIKNIENPPETRAASSAAKTGGDAGAAKVVGLEETTLDDLSFSGNKAVGALSKVGRLMNPYNRLMTSSIKSVRFASAKLMESPLMLNMHKDGKTLGAAAETLFKQYDGHRASVIRAINGNFQSFKKSDLVNQEPNMTQAMFNERVSIALRNNDADSSGNDYITSAAKSIRKEVLEPMRKDLERLNLLPKDLDAKFADTYLHRLWSKEKLIANAREAKEMLRSWATEKVDESVFRTEAKIQDIELGLKKRIQELEQRKQNVLAKVSENSDERLTLQKLFEPDESFRQYLKKELDDTSFNSEINFQELDDVLTAVDFVVSNPKKPVNLYEFAKKEGGIIDDEGWFGSVDVRFRRNQKEQMTIDDFGEKAFEAGYYKERPDIQELQEDILNSYSYKDSTPNAPRYSDEDAELSLAYDYYNQNLGEYELFLDELGIDARSFKKDVKDYITLRKKGLRAERKGLNEDISKMRTGATRALEKIRPLLKEKKKLQAQKNSLSKRIARNYETKIKKAKELSERRAMRMNDELIKMRNAVGEGYSEYIDEVVEDVYAKLTSTNSDNIPDFITPITRGALKGRHLDILDNIAEPFLENDVSKVMERYIRTVGAEASLTEVMGDARMTKQFADIDDEFTRMLNAAPDEKARTKLTKEYRKNRDELERLRDILRGTYKQNDNPDSVFSVIGEVMADIQFMAKLGGVTVSSLTDMFRVNMLHGMDEAFGDLLSRISVPEDFSKLAKEDLLEARFGLETTLATRVSTLAELSDPLARGHAATRLSGAAAQQFSKMTLINHWNDLMKNWAHNVAQNRILRLVTSDMSPDDSAYMKFLGFSDSDIRIIGEQYKKHGKSSNKARLSGISRWDDTGEVNGVARRYKAALRKEADTAIVTKGIGDTPLVMHKTWGKLIFQFQSFMFASHQRMIMRGMQQADMAAMSGMLAMIAGGMMVAAIKRQEYEFSADLKNDTARGEALRDWSPQKWAMEGIDRSGVIAPFLHVNNIYERAGGFGINQMMGAKPASRFAMRSVGESVFGPTLGSVADIGSVVWTANAPFASDKEVRPSDVNAIRRIIPFQNLIGVKHLFDAAQGGIVEGLPEQ